VCFVSDAPRPPSDEELEELPDDVIVAQESLIHVPQPRANVATDHPTVVIAESVASPARPTVRTRRTTEQTVVIRDRRSLERTRRAISERQQLKHKPRRVEAKTLYLLALAAVGSLLVGTLIAAFVDSRKDDRLRLTPSTATHSGPPAASNAAKPIDTVELDSLPVVHSRRRNSSSSSSSSSSAAR
jgi:hypothetical protein